MAFTPYGYQNPYYPPPMQDNLMQMRQQFQAPVPTPQQDMIWVQGETGAKSYLVANGHTVPLWDSENQTVYIKSVDGAGMPSMRILDYTERTAAPSAAQAPAVEYVPRSEFDALAAQVAALTKEKEGSMANPLFQALGGQMPGPMGQFQKMMQQFQQFRANFQGDPQQEVQKLLQSGAMSQQELNQLQAMAKQFQSLMQ